MKYKVVMQTRQYDAIGTYDPRTVEVEASTVSEAITRAINKFHEQKLETGFPVSVTTTPSLDVK